MVKQHKLLQFFMTERKLKVFKIFILTKHAGTDSAKYKCGQNIIT